MSILAKFPNQVSIGDLSMHENLSAYPITTSVDVVPVYLVLDERSATGVYK